MRTKLPAVIYTPICAGKSLGASATSEGGRDRRGLLPNRRAISERASHIEEFKSVFAMQAKVSNKSAVLVDRAIDAILKPLNARMKTLTANNRKELADHQAIDQSLGVQTYFADSNCS